jgi:putative ABC transport system permease protein
VWLATLRDLQWRLRRFVIAVASTAVVFAMTLVLAGLSASFRAETTRVIDSFAIDRWIVRDGVSGPFTSLSALPGTLAADIARRDGVERADPMIIVHRTTSAPEVVDVNLVAAVPGGLGEPKPRRGRPPRTSGEAVVDTSSGLAIDDRFRIGSRDFVVVGETTGLTILAGQPIVFVSLDDAQHLLLGGADIATAVATRGVPADLPPGFVALTSAEVRADLMRPLADAVRSIDFVLVLLWVVAALIVGSVIYLSALERVRDFAVLKATGWSSRSLLAGLAAQAVLVALAAAGLSVGLAALLAPLFPLPVDVPVNAMLLLPVVALVVGLVASLSGLRRAVNVDPALAFGGP